ncbi:hypothetical protein [Candidatus Hodarchaeum mangrovi]
MSLKSCILLISCLNESFCLKYKIWLNECPSACPYFQFGESGLCNDFKEENFNIKCIYLTRFGLGNDYPKFYCNLLQIESPICKKCVLKEYIESDELNT